MLEPEQVLLDKLSVLIDKTSIFMDSLANGSGGALTATLWVAAGVIIAALIAREVKISEFRQAWINELRADIANFISKADKWIDSYVSFNCESDQQEKKDMAEKLDKTKYGCLQILRRIEMRFKPGDEAGDALIDKLRELLDPSKNQTLGSSKAEWTRAADSAISQARNLLKKEWEVTKNPFLKVFRRATADQEVNGGIVITQKNMTHDELLKFVFDNVRNVLICASLITAAAAIFRYRAELPLGGSWNGFLAIALAIAGMGLLSWNLIHGVATIARPYKTNRSRTLFVLIPLGAIYMSAGWAILSAVPRIQTLHQSDSVVTHAPAPNQPLQRDKPPAAHP